ncbi:N-acetylmannosamine-6-phosphate 2-epimerase [Paenibacillus sp. Marseille-Q4541]|uniref:N-acetylmannosamine-6-phosphate 2-epimerase n=1 Tax=Paenibacillus sp. Marseille-Q4541 TaxID=2831522 RepID=UPI001BABD954|nr:N-acetylmannosamine-6-phosphate 2-epimerase [Paenibacillus sp. Marseille-Q4541]
MSKNSSVLQNLKGKLIVSCQALPEEPLHSSYIMGRMAYAAYLGGAAGIRANSVEDIEEIKKHVSLPMIGIIKKVYAGFDVFITPTMEEVGALVRAGVDIIALDATDRTRPDGTTITEIFPKLRETYPDQLFMADCSTYQEGMQAETLGFDCVGTTLSGYTNATKERLLPDFEMAERLVKDLSIPVIAEGGISTPEELGLLFELGVHTAVVGSAITRPYEITKRFVHSIQQQSYVSRAGNE